MGWNSEFGRRDKPRTSQVEVALDSEAGRLFPAFQTSFSACEDQELILVANGIHFARAHLCANEGSNWSLRNLACEDWDLRLSAYSSPLAENDCHPMSCVSCSTIQP